MTDEPFIQDLHVFVFIAEEHRSDSDVLQKAGDERLVILKADLSGQHLARDGCCDCASRKLIKIETGSPLSSKRFGKNKRERNILEAVDAKHRDGFIDAGNGLRDAIET